MQDELIDVSIIKKITNDPTNDVFWKAFSFPQSYSGTDTMPRFNRRIAQVAAAMNPSSLDESEKDVQ